MLGTIARVVLRSRRKRAGDRRIHDLEDRLDQAGAPARRPDGSFNRTKHDRNTDVTHPGPAAVTMAPSTEPGGVGMVDSGDTAWVLASAALVLFMTPGLALFYGGLVGRRTCSAR